MSPATAKLHAAIIRALKGMLAAWDEWLRQQQTK